MTGAAPSRWRRWRILLALAVLAGLCLPAGVWWLRPEAHSPPTVDLAGADPEVALLLESTRNDVLAAPRSAARWGRLGMVLRAHGFAGESGVCFAEAERLDPREPRWPYYRGLTLVLTDPDQGLTCLRRAIDRLGDGPVAPRFRLVEVLLEQGDLDDAHRQLEQALQREPEHPRGRLLQSRLALARQDDKGALAGLDGCWDDPRARRQAHHLAAEAWQRLGDSSRAEKLLAIAAKLPADVPWDDPLVEEVNRLMVGVRARLTWAGQLGQQGQGREAVRVLQGVVEDYPREVSAWVMLGRALQQQDQLGLAERALLRAVEIDPGTVEGWFHLGVVRVLAGRKREGADAFVAAIRLKPDHARAHFYLGLCLKDLGDVPGARRAFDRALRCQPDYAEASKARSDLIAAGTKKPSGP
jgi:cytochrome c-type biogenesis protein CcmH/NrfG